VRGGLLLVVWLAAFSAGAHTADVYAEVNVLGSVGVSVRDAKGAPACANFWWVMRLTGSVRQLGRRCGVASFETPSVLGMFSLASKLRASAEPGTSITVTAGRETVALKIPM
jgi:hypothetical protein